MSLTAKKEISVSLLLPSVRRPSNLIITYTWMLFVNLIKPSQPYKNCIQSFSTSFTLFYVYCEPFCVWIRGWYRPKAMRAVSLSSLCIFCGQC